MVIFAVQPFTFDGVGIESVDLEFIDTGYEFICEAPAASNVDDDKLSFINNVMTLITGWLCCKP
jgi:hypothetical protein